MSDDSQFALLQHALAIAEHSTRASSIEKILAAEVRRLSEDAAALREALEPFAECSRVIHSWPNEDMMPIWVHEATEPEDRVEITVEHIRRAARALKGQP